MIAGPRWRGWLQALPLLCLGACQAPPETRPQAPQQPLPRSAQHAELVRGHLAELVASQQPPCGAVLEYTRHGRLDYRVECESGRVYRVRVSADGRVVVSPHEPPRPAPAPR